MSHKKPIHQIGDLGRILQTYQSVTEAAITTKINKRNITRCLTEPGKHLHAGNYKWKYVDTPPETKPSIWFHSFPDVEQKLIKQVSLNHKGSLKFLPKYIYLIHLLIAARGTAKIINASNFADIICYRNFDIILQGCVNAGVVQVIQGVQVTDVMNDQGEAKRISSTYGLTKEYSTKAFVKVFFNSTDGKMIEKMIARNEAKGGISPDAGSTIYLTNVKTQSLATIGAEALNGLKPKYNIQPILKQILATPDIKHALNMVDEREKIEALYTQSSDQLEEQAKPTAKIEAFKILDQLAKTNTLKWYSGKKAKMGILTRLLNIHLDSKDKAFDSHVTFIEEFVEKMMAANNYC